VDEIAAQVSPKTAMEYRSTTTKRLLRVRLDPSQTKSQFRR
jgi:hypothetical protein